MDYPDAVNYLEAFVKQAEAWELNAAEFREKIEPYRLSFVQRASGYPSSQRMVAYVFNRLINYVEAGRFLQADRVSIRSDLYRLKMAAAFEAKP